MLVSCSNQLGAGRGAVCLCLDLLLLQELSYGGKKRFLPMFSLPPDSQTLSSSSPASELWLSSLNQCGQEDRNLSWPYSCLLILYLEETPQAWVSQLQDRWGLRSLLPRVWLIFPWILHAMGRVRRRQESRKTTDFKKLPAKSNNPLENNTKSRSWRVNAMFLLPKHCLFLQSIPHGQSKTKSSRESVHQCLWESES